MHLDNPVTNWDTAFSDAQMGTQEAKSRILRLRHAIKTFEFMRDSGEPFPSKKAKTRRSANLATFGSTTLLMSQTRLLGQSSAKAIFRQSQFTP